MHAGRGARRRDVDAIDLGMGEGTAHEGRFQRAGQMDVVDVFAGARDQRVVLDAGDRLSDELESAHAG